jgi:hypothetical protein
VCSVIARDLRSAFDVAEGWPVRKGSELETIFSRIRRVRPHALASAAAPTRT